MLLIIAAVLFILWILGFSLQIGGGFIHILLVIAVVVVVYHLIRGRRAV
jgi:hypothetical protein